MTPEERALRDAWLQELWPVCRGTKTAARTPQKSSCKSCGRRVEKVFNRGAPRRYCLVCRPARKVG